MFRKTMLATAISVVSVSAMATGEIPPIEGFNVSGGVGMSSDYRWRGISQTDRDGAVQGWLEISTDDLQEGQFYTGVWASNVNFEFGNTQAHIETDFYTGYRHALSDRDELDVGVTYYNYPSISSANFWEPYIKYNRTGIFSDVDDAQLTFQYSNDYVGSSEDGYYVSAEWGTPVWGDRDRGFVKVGHTEIDTFEDYLDWEVGYTIPFGRFNWTLSYIDTDLDVNKNDDSTVVLGVEYSF